MYVYYKCVEAFADVAVQKGCHIAGRNVVGSDNVRFAMRGGNKTGWRASCFENETTIRICLTRSGRQEVRG